MLPAPRGLPGRRGRNGVAALVLRVTGVAANPWPPDLSAPTEGRELLPQIAVLHRLTVRRLPAFGLPAGEPKGHTFDQVFTVGAYRYLTSARVQRRAHADNRGRQLHLIIRRVVRSTR